MPLSLLLPLLPLVPLVPLVLSMLVLLLPAEGGYGSTIRTLPYIVENQEEYRDR